MAGIAGNAGAPCLGMRRSAGIAIGLVCSCLPRHNDARPAGRMVPGISPRLKRFFRAF
jgi:hypothetical protein